MRDADEMAKFLASQSDPGAISTAYSLRTLIQNATYPVDYAADRRWADAIVPTADGVSLLEQVAGHAISTADLHLALFGLFWFEEPLIDARASDLRLAKSLIQEEALSKKLFWPMIQGRTLYDRYNTVFEDIQNDVLTPPAVLRLLKDAPIGVYQSGRLLAGPLGILDSNASRQFPPQQSLGLWHCPMLDCRQLHRVTLSPPNVPLVEAYRLLERAAVARWGNESRWEIPVATWPLPPRDLRKVRSAMPIFLGDCIVDDDRVRLLECALESEHGDNLRAALEGTRHGRIRGNASKVVAELSAEEQLQLLLVLSDGDTKRLIDNLVWSGEIKVPTAELREVQRSKMSWPELQLSNLGIRNDVRNPVLFLRNLILAGYAKEGSTADLDWRLRKQPGATTDAALMQYLRNVKPPAAIDALILTSPSITKFVADALDTSIDQPGDQSRRVLAWKFGFDEPRQDRRLAVVHKTLEAFRDTVTRIRVAGSDEDRQAIRSAGVNAFVEFEGFLEETIVYLVWLLCSDHPGKTLFVYTKSAGTALVPVVLGTSLMAGTDTLRWSNSGNTLGTCVRYLQQLCEWMKSLPGQDRSGLQRPAKQVHETSGQLAVFPFKHVELWADANPTSLAALTEVVASLVSILGRADLAGVRNGLEHYREIHKFPVGDRIANAITCLSSFVRTVEDERLFPKLYWFAGSKIDMYLQRSIELVDYSGNVFVQHLPAVVTGIRPLEGLSQERPALIAPGNLLGLPNSDLLFGISQDSVFARYWRDYPVRGKETVLNVAAAGKEELGAGEDDGALPAPSLVI